MFPPKLALIAFTAACALLLSVRQSPADEAASMGKVQPLPELAKAEAWKTPEGSAVTIEQWPDRLGLAFRDFTEGSQVRFDLRKPVPVPEWAQDFLMTVNSNGGFDLGFVLRLVIRDAKGREYFYELESALLAHGIQYFPNNQRPRPIRISVPGLSRPVVAPKAAANIYPVDPENRAAPESPLTMVGLELKSLACRVPADGSFNPVMVGLGNFVFTKLNWRQSPFYYSFADEERFGELDPVPLLHLGSLGPPAYGEDITLAWEVRDRYDGQPFLAGEKKFALDSKDPAYALSFLQGIEIPVHEKGTYWVRVKRKWSRTAGRIPERIDEFDIRLDVLRGDKPRKREPLTAKDARPGALAVIAPERKSFVFAPGDRKLNVDFVLPEEKAENLTWKVEVRPVNTDDILKAGNGPLTAESRGASVDLGELPAGAYRVTAEVLDGKGVLDRVERVIGLKGEEKVATDVPANIPSWKEFLARDRSLVYFMPTNYWDKSDPKERWELLKNYFDQAATVTPDMEYLFRWRDVEILPGVYDWTEVDRALNYAGEKGITALLWPSIVGGEPEWLPALYEEPRNAEGKIFNAMPYTFHGGRLNLWHADGIRDRALDFLAAVAKRYKGHPAVHGYYVLTEHPADMPTAGWYIGGSAETLEKYRADCRERFASLKKLNARWGSSYKDWNAVGVPPETASQREQLDWMIFLRDGIGQYLVDATKAIRAVDDHRIIQVYCDGADDKFIGEFVKLGTMTADGGSQYPETFGSQTMAIADMGWQRRAEEVSVGQWSVMFPTQLDSTLYNMLLGGGGNANIKMFIAAGKPFDELRKPTYSLDRFEKFIPIWNELRQTEVLPRQVYTLFDRNAQLMDAGLKFHGDDWATKICMQAGLLSPFAPIDIAVKGKMLHLPRAKSYEKDVIDRIVEYVEQGGTLLMSADAGRFSPDLPKEDWVLLRRLGFQPPETNESNGGYIETMPVPGEVFSPQAGVFRLREFWPANVAEGDHVIANFSGDAARPAITWHNFGKGRVVLVWASTIVPDGYPFLRDIARWAGVQFHAESEPSSFWTNLLKHRSREDYYGLVYRSSYPNGKDEPPQDGRVRWFVPEGTYRVTELIDGQDLGTFTSQDLVGKGLSLRLNPFAVAIHRLQKVTTP